LNVTMDLKLLYRIRMGPYLVVVFIGRTMVHATKYLNSTNHPFAPFHIYMEGKEDKEFWDLFTD